MKILFAAIGAYGHLYPMMPLALAAAEAGHQVTIATGGPFLDRLPLPTVPAYTGLALEDVEAETRRRHPDASGMDLSAALFADVAAGHIGPVMIENCERLEPDLVVYEVLNTGAGLAADILQLPAIAFSISLKQGFFPMVHEGTISHQREQWSTRGLEPPDGPLLAATLLDPVPPSLHLFDDDLPIDTIAIRSVAYSDSASEVPPWLAEPRTRPRIFLTLGTVSFGAVEVLRRVIEETASLDLDVLVAVGPVGDPSLLGDLSDRVRVERFVAQSRVLGLVDLMVHHGGTGSVLGALEAGIPQLILPQGADQFINADLLSQAGAARALLEPEPSAGTIREAVSALIGESAERRVARRLRDEMAAMPSPAEVVDRLSALAC
ncbi:MAG TPA: glycosyltransferase [Microlunatus sp.]